MWTWTSSGRPRCAWNTSATPLTNVQVPAALLGRMAVEMLLTAGAPTTTLVPPVLTDRLSCGEWTHA
ncbi:hypothetical protein [Actinoplanes sp. URMC 104]|uniref:hypothetical protein n=1 Tax=Actinoplanes sp. URMC 104 TaxID=3423409 RepID=UPI003F1A060F